MASDLDIARMLEETRLRERGINEAAFMAYLDAHPEDKDSEEFLAFRGGVLVKRGPTYDDVRCVGYGFTGQPKKVLSGVQTGGCLFGHQLTLKTVCQRQPSRRSEQDR